MKNILSYLLLCLPIIGFSQNEFIGRDFWKTAPDVATVKAKIAEGNDPVELNNFGFDAITYAILENAPLETIQFLLDMEGNEVNKITHDGRNYLLWAGYKGNLPLMKDLIARKSDTKLVDDHGYNLMAFTAVGGQQNTEVYDLILANGGKVDDANRAGANALLLLAATMKDTKIMDYFHAKGLDIHTKDKKGNGLFNYAASRGNLPMMKKFVEMGLDYQTPNMEGGNAFMFASSGARGHTNTMEVYQYLADLGLEVDIVTSEGKTPLHNVAFRTKDAAIADFFTNNCVNVNQIDKDGNTAFLNAVRYNNLDMATHLSPNVKNVNHTNKEGYSALTYAVRRGAMDAVKMLADKGATMDVVDTKGNNLVYHLFDAYGSRTKKAFDQLLPMLLEAKVATTGGFENGNNLIHVGVEKGETALIEKALALGCAVNHKNKDGLTPLHLAAMKATDKEVLTMLLNKGADKKALTDFEESAFDLASENEMLNEQGVDLGFLKIK
ncbi:MAG: ankyrin repeat domain-containing protein [Bacteroidota bacterium]